MTTFVDDQRDVYGADPICAMLADRAVDVLRADKARLSDPSRLPERARRDTAPWEKIERIWTLGAAKVLMESWRPEDKTIGPRSCLRYWPPAPEALGGVAGCGLD